MELTENLVVEMRSEAEPILRGFSVALLEAVRCPKDGARFAIADGKFGEFVSEAAVRCMECGSVAEIHDGILRLLPLQRPLISVARAEQNARDRGANRYDAHFSDWSNAVEMRAFFSDASAFAGKTVLDLACGTGRVTARLLDTAGAVLGADFSEHSLRNLAKKGIDSSAKLGLVWCDVTQLRLSPGYFDTVVSAQLLEHITCGKQRASLLEQICGWLKPAGLLLVSAYYHNLIKRVLRRPREGFHESGIFFHRFTGAELRREVSRFFLVREMKPLQVDPRLFPGASPVRGWLARLLEKAFCTPLLGQLVFVRARKPAVSR